MIDDGNFQSSYLYYLYVSQSLFYNGIFVWIWPKASDQQRVVYVWQHSKAESKYMLVVLVVCFLGYKLFFKLGTFLLIFKFKDKQICLIRYSVRSIELAKIGLFLRLNLLRNCNDYFPKHIYILNCLFLLAQFFSHYLALCVSLKLIT